MISNQDDILHGMISKRQKIYTGLTQEPCIRFYTVWFWNRMKLVHSMSSGTFLEILLVDLHEPNESFCSRQNSWTKLRLSKKNSKPNKNFKWYSSQSNNFYIRYITQEIIHSKVNYKYSFHSEQRSPLSTRTLSKH